MLYVIDNTNLNQDTFNESFGYYVISYHSRQGGYLQRLSLKNRGAKFHRIGMISDKTSVDLESALSFKKLHAKSIIKTFNWSYALKTMILYLLLNFLIYLICFQR